MVMADSLDRFFNPKGIAVLGASSDTSKLGYAVARNLIQGGYPGSVHFVNPKGGTLFNRTFYLSTLDVPEPVDLAVVIVPASSVLQALTDIGVRGIQSAIITSGGFRETGESGATLERDLLSICRRYGIRLIGPNCIGLVDTHYPLDTTFLPPPPTRQGNIAFLSQSGAFCAAVIDWSRRQGFGFSRLASLGNQADVTETDLLPAFAEDTHTRSIALYLESIPDGIRFLDVTRRITPKLPIVAMKVGRTSSGKIAAASHTGALAGMETAIHAAFEKAGIIRAQTSEEMFDWARAFACLPLPPGRNVAILTNAGGPGVIAADSLSDHHLFLSSLESKTLDALTRNLPAAASVQNPVDMLASASPEDYEANLNLLLEDGNVHSVLVIIPPSPIGPTVNIAKKVIPIIKNSPKPIFPVLMGSELVQESFDEFSRNDIPCFPFPERAVSALGKLADRVDFLSRREEEESIHLVTDETTITGMLDTIRGGDDNPELAFRLMDSIGIPVASIRLAVSRKEAGEVAAEIGFPLVAKIHSPDIPHKSDVGGVILNCSSVAEARKAFDELMVRAKKKQPSARLKGVTFQRQISEGQEVILGFVKDPQFGPVIMFGAGGIDVEGLKDVAFALAPLHFHEADRLMQTTWAGRKLAGFRNLAPADRAAVADALVRLSWLAYRYPQIVECEVNPLKVLAQGVFAVDVRLKLQG